MTAQPQQLVRKMTHFDLQQVLAWRNHPEVRRHMYNSHEISGDEHAQWFERSKSDPTRHLLIFEVDRKPQGFINIHEIAKGGIADWGFYACPNAPKGTGSLLGHTTLEYAFNELGFHKICGQVLSRNIRSIQFHERIGFKLEGTLREQHFYGNTYEDVLCFGLLQTEWLNLKR